MPRPRHLPITLALLFGLATLASAQFEAPQVPSFSADPAAPPASAELLAEVDAIAPAQPFTVALKISLQPGWHTYWLNPGSPGYPPSLSWDLPEGFTVSDLVSLTPSRFGEGELAGYGYESTSLHLALITPPANLAPDQQITLRAAASWLACKTECIPGSQGLELTLPSTAETPGEGRGATLIAGALPLIPSTLPHPVAVSRTDGSWHFRFSGAADLAASASAPPYVFPLQGGMVDPAKPASHQVDGADLVVSLPAAEGAPATWEGEPAGILAFDGQGLSFPVGALPTLSATPGTSSPAGEAPSPLPAPAPTNPEDLVVTEESRALQRAAAQEIASWGASYLGDAPDSAGAEKKPASLPLMIVFGIIAGLILNLMPCVFPVLAIKVMTFASQSGEEASKIRFHGIVFTLGVLMSMWLLGGIAAAASLTWGFQLKNPAVLSVLIIVLFFFGLSLAGLIEIGTSLTGAGAKAQSKQGYAGAFASGILAVVVATPCTGPLMAPILAFALTEKSILNVFSIFSALGLGLASPYLTLSFLPKLVQKLPRPGAWMETFKQAMAFPIFGTVIWLLWIFVSSTGNDGMLWLLVALLLLSLGTWIWGRWNTPVKKGRTRLIATSLALLCFAGTFSLTRRSLSFQPERFVGHTVEKFGLTWEVASATSVIRHRNKGRTVFLDFTADW